MRNIFDIAGKIVFIIAIIAIVYLNVSVYYKPEVRTVQKSSINYDVLLQLQHLKNEIDDGAAKDMQQLYPEGFVFLHSLYALAWCDFLDDISKGSTLFKEGLGEVTKSTDLIDSEEGRSTFSEYQPLRYGAFYVGWSAYVLGRKLRLSIPDTTGAYLFKLKCHEIAEFIRTSSTPYASSYRGTAWPADMVLCIAALNLHDEIYNDAYGNLIEKWMSEVKSRLDDHGLVPHSVDAGTGEPLESARGSSQSLMLIFLNMIDRDFASKQFRIYDSLFVATRFGLTGIREYPKGTRGLGDIDSGPVLLGIGGASSIVGMRTLAAFGNNKSAIEVRNGIEAFGFSRRNGKGKSYLFETLPIADAFITWAHVGINPTSQARPSFMNFHAYSILVVGLISLFALKPWRRFRSVNK